MCGQHTALSGIGWSQIEIKLATIVLLSSAFVLDERSINNAARRRVAQSAISLFDKETLGDALVHNHDSDGRLLSYGVVEVADDSFELRNFEVEHLVSHGVTNTVSINDEVSGHRSLVVVLEHMDGLADEILHLVLDNLLALGLHDEL